MMASSNNIPVLVCAETHKMSYRGGGVQLESITHNEVLNVEPTTRKDMATGGTTSSSGGKDDRDATTLVPRLDVMYDLTPATYVSGIVTELGIVPPSSIAVLLREMNQPLEWKQ
jgi:translation initiation factor eIF-2B subunit delta